MTSIEFKSGSRAWRRGQPVTIKAVLALDTVLVTTAEGRSETVPISELAAGPVADETLSRSPTT